MGPKCCSTKLRKPRKRKRNRVWQSRIRRATHTIATRRLRMPTTSPRKKRHRRRRKPSPLAATATTTPIPILHRLTNPTIAVLRKRNQNRKKRKQRKRLPNLVHLRQRKRNDPAHKPQFKF